MDSRPGRDRRAVSLRLTVEGGLRVERVLADRARPLLDLVRVLSPEQRRQLDEIAGHLLRSMVQQPVDAAHVCRLCDAHACPAASCPVHQEALRRVALDPAGPETDQPMPSAGTRHPPG